MEFTTIHGVCFFLAIAMFVLSAVAQVMKTDQLECERDRERDTFLFSVWFCRPVPSMCSATTAAALALRSQRMAFSRRHKLDLAVSRRHRTMERRARARAKMVTALRPRHSAAATTVNHCHRCSNWNPWNGSVSDPCNGTLSLRCNDGISSKYCSKSEFWTRKID